MASQHQARDFRPAPKMTTANVAAVILNYRNVTDTIAAVKSVLASDCVPASTVIVDNASGDGSVVTLREWLNRTLGPGRGIPGPSCSVEVFGGPAEGSVYLVTSTFNGGYSCGNNLGIRIARESACPDYFLILNNDAKISAGALRAMLQDIQVAKVGIVVPLILYDDNRTIWYAGGTAICGTAFHFMRGRDIRTTAPVSHNVKFATGCALLVRTEVFDKVGAFDERYFLYGEDVEFCRRVRSSWSIRFCAGAVVRHQVSASTGGEGMSKCFAYYGRRNQRFTAGNGTFRIVTFLAVDFLFVVVPTMMRCWGGGKIWSQQLSLMFQGIGAALRGSETGRSAAVE